MYLWYCLSAVLAGTLIPLQAAINAALRAQIGSPYYATFISVTVSTISVALVILLGRMPLPTAASLSQAPWWVWSGGIVGVVYIFMALLLAPKLGATALVASIIGGQLICSLLMDQFGLVGFAIHPLSLQRAAGLLLLGAGVFLIQKF